MENPIRSQVELSQDMRDRIHEEAEDRRKKEEDKDPVMAMDEALAAGENVLGNEAEVILRAHENGPWTIQSADDLRIFSKWCEKSGNPLGVSNDIENRDGIAIYQNDFGDCVMAESAKGKDYAVWTRKGRVQVGFRNEDDASKFRNFDPVFSMEQTGNKRLGLVVLEGGDNEEMKKKVVEYLKNM